MGISLFDIFLMISLLGILFLLILSNILEPRLADITDINYLYINKKVRVQGEIFNIRSYKESDFQVISIKDRTGKIEITTDKILNLKINQTIIVTGIVKEYKQTMQIQAERIIISH